MDVPTLDSFVAVQQHNNFRDSIRKASSRSYTTRINYRLNRQGLNTAFTSNKITIKELFKYLEERLINASQTFLEL